MKIVVVSGSRAWDRHLLRVLGARHEVALRRTMDEAQVDEGARTVTLVHGAWLRRQPESPGMRAFGVAADVPTLEDMFAMTGLGARAYFNSYMADVHYEQMLELVSAGQGWYPPALLARALDLARERFELGTGSDLLAALTPREREIALDVARGMSNREVASTRKIAESSVKSHLTRIFKKLDLKSRTELAVACNRAESRSDSPLGQLGSQR